jgi:transposase
VLIADLPARPIEKGRPGPGLLSHVLTNKYGDHLPLHRQEGIFKRHGVDIKRSTMCDWVRDCADLLSPIVRYMQK